MIDTVISLRGGAKLYKGGDDYYDQFELDYGSDDKVRIAGATRGFLKSGKLSGIPESDAFLKWLNNHLESGPEPLEPRVKPFHAIDFGSKSDLKPKENPKILIVNRRLTADKNGVLSVPSDEIDIEERIIWQPWLRSRCDFVVRYIVPNRLNIIKLMEAKNRFSSQVVVMDDQPQQSKEVTDGTTQTSKRVWARMTFRPRLVGRLIGRRDVVIRQELDASALLGSEATSGARAGKKGVQSNVFDGVKTLISKFKK